jgi:hypothetical protein
MALVRCPDCRKEISSEAPACPGCGRPMKSGTPSAASPPPVAAPVAPPPKKMGGFKKGCLYVGGGVVAAFVALMSLPTMLRECGSPPPAATPEPTRAPASISAQTAGAKAAAKMAKTAAADPNAGKNVALSKLMNDMAKSGGGLIRGYEISDRLCYLKLDPEIWNAWSPAQQQQAMDLLARAPVWKESKISLVVLRVYATDVGELSGGWGGDWKFKRR